MMLEEVVGLVICMMLVMWVGIYMMDMQIQQWEEIVMYCQAHKEIPSEWGDLNCTAILNNETVAI